jgi:hypothetical protein
MVRFKNRWLLVEFIPVEDGVACMNHQLGRKSVEITGKEIWAALKQSVIVNFGDAGWGAVGYSMTGSSARMPAWVCTEVVFSEVLLVYHESMHHTSRQRACTNGVGCSYIARCH